MKGQKYYKVELLQGSALFLYKLPRNNLEMMGLVINPHDPCLTNMKANGAHMTVCWYVDELKISHSEYPVVSVPS